MKKSYQHLMQRTRKNEGGIVLIEALIAVLLFSIGILGLVGLQATMIRGTTDGKLRADAHYVASKQISALWASDPGSLAALVGAADVSDVLGITGATMTTVRADPTTCPGDLYCFVVTVNWQTPDGNTRSVVNSTHLAPNPLPP